MTWVVITAPFELTPGTQYAAALNLDWEEKVLANDENVTKKFTDAGFTNVQVDLPNKRVTGTWSGTDEEATLPSEVSTVWEWQS